jgi:hypothetical protein
LASAETDQQGQPFGQRSTTSTRPRLIKFLQWLFSGNILVHVVEKWVFKNVSDEPNSFLLFGKACCSGIILAAKVITFGNTNHFLFIIIVIILIYGY